MREPAVLTFQTLDGVMQAPTLPDEMVHCSKFTAAGS